MRVTDKMVFDNGATRIARGRERLERATAQNATGLKVEHPWDGPGEAGLILTAHAAGERAVGIRKGVERANDEAAISDGALQSLQDVLARARELATQQSNDTYTAAERKGAAAEVDALLRQAVGLLNAKAGDRYVFGGMKDGAAPFDTSGAYLGDANVRQVEVAPGVLSPASVRMDVAVKGAGGGVDLFTTLQALSTALGANDAASVRGTLDSLSALTSQLSSARATLGAQMQTFDLSQSALRATADSQTQAASALEDADPFQAATDLALAERALDAALSATAKSFKLSLLDKLG